MVTDPVRKIRSESFESAMDVDISDPLRQVAALPASIEDPYLTVALDWTPGMDDPGRTPGEDLRRSEQRNLGAPASTSHRPARTWLTSELKALAQTLEPRSAQLAAFEAAVARIDAWLDSDLDPAASGVYIVAGNGVFMPLALGVPMTNAVHFAPIPSIHGLAHLSEDYETYAVLVADQEQAELSFLTQGVRERAVSLQSTLYPRHQRQGGPNSRRYQARAGERVFHFARAVASEVEAALREDDVNVLILVGSRVFMTELDQQFSEFTKHRVAGQVPMDLKPWPSVAVLVEATEELDLAAERQQEADTVAEVRNLLGQNQALAGTADVVQAVMAHQVSMLVMNEDYAEPGWADHSVPLLGLGEVPSEHPAGGDPAHLVAVDLAEELIRLVLQTGGDIELVHTSVPVQGDTAASRGAGDIPRAEAAKLLDDVGGVGALLRFTT